MPSASGIFSLTLGGITVSEAGVPANSASTFRMFNETTSSGSEPGTIQTGIAVTNLEQTASSVEFQLFRLDGTYTTLSSSRQIAGNGHFAVFFHELFPSVPLPFQGIVRIISSGFQLSVVGLRARYNERRDFLITTTPPASETAAASAAEMVFPHLVDSAGYTTQFVLFS